MAIVLMRAEKQPDIKIALRMAVALDPRTEGENEANSEIASEQVEPFALGGRYSFHDSIMRASPSVVKGAAWRQSMENRLVKSRQLGYIRIKE